MLVCACSASAQLPVYNVPDDPAFVFLRVSPKAVANPGTLPALGIALANGINGSGKVESGLAVSFLPSSLLRLSPTMDTYRVGSPGFWWYNTQISIGSVRASGDTASTDFAVGFRTMVIGPEPYADSTFRRRVKAMLRGCQKSARAVDTAVAVLERRTQLRPFPTVDTLGKLLPADPGVRISADTVEITYIDRGPNRHLERAVIRRLRAGVAVDRDTVFMWPARASGVRDAEEQECSALGTGELLRLWMRERWNNALFAIAAARGTRLVNSELGRRESSGYAIWSVAALPVRWTRDAKQRPTVLNVGQLAGQLRYEHRAAKDDVGPRGNDWSAGVRGLMGRAGYNGFAEWTHLVNPARDGSAARRTSWSVGSEFMTSTNLWLLVGFGDRWSEISKHDKTVIFMNLKWALARESRLAP